jgi:hypothetical protein
LDSGFLATLRDRIAGQRGFRALRKFMTERLAE